MPQHTLSPSAEAVEFELDNQPVIAYAGENILEAARRYGVEIPHLCYKQGYRAAGNCRACMVEIDGERALAPSCCRQPAAGMKVSASNNRVRHAQKMIVELLIADTSTTVRKADSELTRWAQELDVKETRFAARQQPPPDKSHPAMTVNLDSCIQCTRCVRACREEQVNNVIGYAGRGASARIVFDFDTPMGQSTCVGCGECVQACPTGALAPFGDILLQQQEKSVPSLCPYCGVGCQTTYHVKDNRISYVEGRDGPANHSRLCVKGRYGADYAHHPHRLTSPLIRRDDVPKDANGLLEPDNWRDVFREVDWKQALDFAADGLRAIRDEKGGGALAGFGSAKGSNEEAYLFQKLVRTGFGVNNVDHCTRLCHASSVAALLEGIGSGAVSNQVSDVLQADVAFVIGANPTVNHPVAATMMKNAAARGTRLIVADPRRSELAAHAEITMQMKPDSDVALLNAMMHVIITENLTDEEFIRSRTKDFELLRAQALTCPPEKMEDICGIPAEEIRQAARLYGTAERAMIFWGMGVSQHTHGTDNARCLIALAMMTGNIGRPGCGLHPLRGQNNVQGASDAGLIPMMFPDYQRVDDESARKRFEELWGMPLDNKPGLTVVEVIDAACQGEICGMYVMGENPAMSDPDAAHARQGLASLQMLVVQDIFLTETAALADVVLPASVFVEKTGTFTNTDRMVQLGRRALDVPGLARQDLWIIQQIARRLDLKWKYRGENSGVRRVFEEMRRAMPSIAGITWERLQSEHSVTYPCRAVGDAGEPIIFTEKFPTTDGLGRFVPAAFSPAAERPDADYPLVLITGRELEHWHTGAMTRRTRVLDALEPAPTVYINPQELSSAQLQAGDTVTVRSRRGAVSLTARGDGGVPRGAVFIPFCYYEAAANMLTNPVLDPDGKIPEFKYCAVKVEKGGEPTVALSFGGGVAAH
ncbi:formate dehydrogenase subunit alpha [Candidatus Persebacteraceae bacterium Df01]|uniref:NADH-quinone oxidoreductase subunit G n=1 Tax=Candidatus Doriopsillibacter californiensis TaxID=2970740 RepID=A0ABT7QLN3_9GAMM|nr:formate dehydrogenase subunit alpha [Candidatus Persebacteraceae bacterium Df01]